MTYLRVSRPKNTSTHESLQNYQCFQNNTRSTGGGNVNTLQSVFEYTLCLIWKAHLFATQNCSLHGDSQQIPQIHISPLSAETTQAKSRKYWHQASGTNKLLLMKYVIANDERENKFKPTTGRWHTMSYSLKSVSYQLILTRFQSEHYFCAFWLSSIVRMLKLGLTWKQPNGWRWHRRTGGRSPRPQAGRTPPHQAATDGCPSEPL